MREWTPCTQRGFGVIPKISAIFAEVRRGGRWVGLKGEAKIWFRGEGASTNPKIISPPLVGLEVKEVPETVRLLPMGPPAPPTAMFHIGLAGGVVVGREF